MSSFDPPQDGVTDEAILQDCDAILAALSAPARDAFERYWKGRRRAWLWRLFAHQRDIAEDAFQWAFQLGVTGATGFISTVPSRRDSDGSPKGGDAEGGSVRSTTARVRRTS